MSKNILILSGSPRKGGNTDKLVSAFQEGALSAGKNVTLFRTADLNIGGCLACKHCFSNNTVCIQKDDMEAILEVLRKADVVVFASPVYYFTVSAQLKLAIDRSYAVPSDKTTVKQGVLLLTCGDDTDEAAEGTILTYRQMLEYRKWEDAGVLCVPGLHKKDDIVGREELEHATKLGKVI